MNRLFKPLQEVAKDLPPGIAERIDLINEYRTWRISSCQIKQAPDHALTLPTPF
jgi:hypothetical protein